MKLSQVHEAMWPTYKDGKPEEDQKVTVYITLQGVLADLKKTFSRQSVHWTNPLVYYARLGAMAGNPEHVAEFWQKRVPGMPGAGEIYQAAQEISGGDVIVLVDMKPNPKKIPTINDGIRAGAQAWIADNLSPAPVGVQFVSSRDKIQLASQEKTNILVDDDINAIKSWERQGGTGIISVRGRAESTVEGIRNPFGERSVEIDLDDKRGLSTDLQSATSHSKAIYRLDGVRFTMKLNTIPGKLNGQPFKVPTVSVFESSDIVMEMIKRLKTTDLDQKHFYEMIERAAKATKEYFAGTDYNFENILVPHSNSEIANWFSELIGNEFGGLKPIILQRNQDIESIQVNMEGAARAAKTWSENSGDPKKRRLNPYKREQFRRGHPERYLWTPEEVARQWKSQAAEWVAGTRRTKDLDLFVRKSNLSNLYIIDESQDLHGDSLIVDDVTTYGMTITSLAQTALQRGSNRQAGVVLWMK